MSENPTPAPEITLPANQDESAAPKPRGQRGGWRPGAGRKPNQAKKLLRGFTRKALELAAEQVDCQSVIEKLLRSKSERVKLETLSFLRDTLWGRPMTAVKLSIGIERLASLSDAELEEYAVSGVLPPLLEAGEMSE